jgi:hypothetical protein
MEERTWSPNKTPFLRRQEGLQENSKGEHKEFGTVAHADLPTRQPNLNKQYCQSYVIDISITRKSSPPAERWALFSAVSAHKQLKVMNLFCNFEGRDHYVFRSACPLTVGLYGTKYESRHCKRLPK